MNARWLAVGQGVFYLVSGLWPIIHYKSFERVTGPKEDDWLVKATGGLIAAAGVSLIKGGLSESVSKETALIGAGHAFVLGTSAGYYSSIGRVSRIYGLDALTEYALAGLWGLARV